MPDLKLLLDYEGSIYLLSAVISLLFALAVFTLQRNAIILREKGWVTPFAITFLVLAGVYSLRFIELILSRGYGGIWQDRINPIKLLIYFSSGVTNYLFFLAGFRLLEPALDKKQLQPLKKWLGSRAYVRWGVFLILSLAALIRLIDGWVVRIPDVIFSAIALFLMGFVLYQNIQFRRDKLMAWVALLSSICYALLYLFYGLILYLSHDQDYWKATNLLLFLISLFLKFGLFFPGLSLMLLISGPVEGINRLLNNITQEQKEYLESDGIVRSICEEFQLSSVGLYIKLPGLIENQIVLYAYSPSSTARNQGVQEFPYKEGTIYDQVMKSGEPYKRYRENGLRLIPGMSKVAVPIFFHKSIIACLEVEIGDERFTETDRINLGRIATLISPAVQAYREIAALNKISQDLAQLQIGITKYKLEPDIREITEKVHDVLSPLATGVSLEIGFSECRGVHPQNQPLAGLIQKQLDAPGEAGRTSPDDNHRWLKEELQIPMVNSSGQKVGEQFLGRFIFATNKIGIRNGHPTLGTNPTHRRAISDLLTDTLLDFVRGYLSQLTDVLGVRLSSLKATKVDNWYHKMDETVRDAGLLWAVVRYPDGKNLVGEDEMVTLVAKLEDPEKEEKWESKRDGFWLYSLDQPEARTYHVIKKVFKDTEATLWLGVGRQGFGRELDYVSPWQYFLVHFCEIADSALRRILELERRQIELAEAQSIATAIMTTAIITHQVVNLTRNLLSVIQALDVAIKDGRLRGNNNHKELIANSLPTRNKLEELFKLLPGKAKPDERRPCSLEEAVKYALELVEDSAVKSGITIKPKIPPAAVINVPFYAAANMLAIVIDNAKDAIRYGNVEKRASEKRVIQIDVREMDDKVICDITDSGPGVPPEIEKKLLKGVCKSNKPNSHGVGLYFSVSLLQTYGGDIILTERGPEPNTTFSIYFPK